MRFSTFIFTTAVGVLPPGYEDEFYCPKGYCMRKKSQPKGFTGPASAFRECYNPSTGETKKVGSWGAKKGANGKSQLEDDGYDTSKQASDCPKADL
eukprot:CAMPEP_0204368032 /NCGR_PEP_ID=MMETSP0469-20131031/43889_1 /ASSEMBLY_ACC=CAM_ASM_000384 /TAXON_ID=2969 /ORGANISM="Oxyrrhis marina" /LENGTH=95 /DNA_ID=CAMNT_0051357527 /DNA_START=19 /DNA_END=306 /DNA_ORIENTATION=+